MEDSEGFRVRGFCVLGMAYIWTSVMFWGVFMVGLTVRFTEGVLRIVKRRVLFVFDKVYRVLYTVTFRARFRTRFRLLYKVYRV